MDVTGFDCFDTAARAALGVIRELLGRDCRLIVRDADGDWTIDGEPDAGYRRTDERRFAAADGRAIDVELAVDLVRRDGVRQAALVVLSDGKPVSAADRATVELAARLLASLVDAERKLSEQTRRAAQAERDARTDPLTGLTNRRGWNELLGVFEEDFRRGHKGGCILAIDVDGLKHVNDTRGHAAGDDLLNQAAKVLRETCRDGAVARTGGDEFGVWSVERDERSVEQFAASILASLQAAGVEAKIGWALHEAGRTIGRTSDEADRRLVAEKRRKRAT